MNINWVLSDSVSIGPEIAVEQLKRLGSFWGSWRTWRSCGTDNVVCNDLTRASELVKRNFQSECNLYLPTNNYQTLGRPVGVRLYEGEFVHDVDHQEEIVAMHLVAGFSDIVLLFGFDLSEPAINTDKISEIRARNWRGLVRQAIVDNSHVQWVLVNHDKPVMKAMSDLENLTVDTMSAVLALNEE